MIVVCDFFSVVESSLLNKAKPAVENTKIAIITIPSMMLLFLFFLSLDALLCSFLIGDKVNLGL